ncbi:MAG TPA: cytochrome c-type biogenesis protein CcmH [Acidimicrobiia bacterium]|nr:cytochrome c-type biogenesis protein CcmH [Acidimicrobiia bacterium]
MSDAVAASTHARVRRRAAWGALAVVVVVSLFVAGRGASTQTAAQEAASIASEVRCPTCEGQSAEVSDAPAAKAVRTFVLQQVQAGQSRGQIERALEDRYGSDILLRPPASGIAGLVWVLPVVALVIALAALAAAFRRWRIVGETPLSDADRDLVAEALDAVPGDGGDGRA